ncbi:MAG TPA: menaquinol oxidoreductase [Geobacteraceae bacterium]
MSPRSPSRTADGGAIAPMENQPSHSREPQPSATTEGPGGRDARTDIEDRIRQLRSRSSRGLVTIAVFLAASIIAVKTFSLFQAIPDRVRIILGTPPSATMIGAALIVYSFSAILTTLSRMTTGSGSYGGFTHVAFLAAFYAFYFFSGSLPENFWAVFAAGVTILGLEAYHIWTWSQEEIRRQQEGEGAQESDDL